jgi:uncharacterized protein
MEPMMLFFQILSRSEFIATLAMKIGKPIFFPPRPGFMIRTIMGEISDVILKGSRISSKRYQKKDTILFSPFFRML